MKISHPFSVLFSFRYFRQVAILSAALLGTFQLFSQTVVTSQGTFVLTPPEKLVDATAARSAKAVADLAISAVTSDAGKVMGDQKNLQPKIDAYTRDNKKYNDNLAKYSQDQSTYNSHLQPYQEELARYDKDLQPHDAAVAAHNAIPLENRDAANYQRLMDSKARLDGWKGNLDTQKAALDSEWAALNDQKNALDRTYSDLSYRYNEWSAEQKTLDVKMGAAYQQLKQLNAYALEINKLLAKWQQPTIQTTNLNTQLEQLKALSNKGWD